VQPFAGLVTVKVYRPGEFITLVELVGVDPAGAPVEGPVQANVAPGVVELPLRVAVVTTQFKVMSGPMAICGGVLLAVAVTTAVLVQPFTVLVVVNVNVPVLVIVATAEVVPPESPMPDQL
jgi:ABC-type amino acid transport system permease subunit